MINWECRQCRASMEAPESLGGEPLECPKCGAGQRVPAAQSRRALWFGASLVVAVIVTGVWLILRTPGTGDQQFNTPGEPANSATIQKRSGDPVVAASDDDLWREFHLTALKSMGASMYVDNYLDEDGWRLTLDDINVCIFGIASHMYVPDVAPYEMQWRLQSGVMFPNDIPVSFLDVYYEGPFSHEIAVAAVKEFYRVTGGLVSIEDVQEATQEAEALFFDVRSRELLKYGYVWEAESRVPETVDSSDFNITGVGGYLIKVRIQEWPTEPYINETGSCRMMIYFAACPPSVTDVASIHASGF